MKKMFWKTVCRAEELKRRVREMLSNDEGMGTVEVILIILVLIGLVIIFKDQLTGLVKDLLSKITKQSNSI